ncbi:helix-turn-helix domain-containing protein [Halapricum hydrolyticum]|uniref:Helix-turn-helix domain-containing protein n=1 Tax=Halapricum hydrolyticum TaxID=2979991 RepID=A0AAE3IB11_9EURY|nr:helix-turn-helix domain-containing protein [Halapricum hydrolyticum]MCU4718331.1 helix-turn-helix domain-containing protein [Halapricum hydrolyticum]MCU4727221.1 helix-turn-helix domain-containing protein [Halapricum hydrolyticum]
MTVIVELTVPSEAFELGRILSIEGPGRVTLETMVPLGGRPTPFVRVRHDVRDEFVQSVRKHPTVSDIRPLNTHDGETLYALEWDPSEDTLFRTILEDDIVLLEAAGSADRWGFELRFPSHETLSEFQEFYLEQNLDVTIDRIYNPTKPDAGPWYGLTSPQRETLAHAVEHGYYSLPRGISTKELGVEFDISDQAVTERLRRGITTLVSNTISQLEDEP